MPELNYWHMKWDLHPDICPCDVHFNDWLEANRNARRTIYHFGTGTHHVVGARQAENGLGNKVFAITASRGEYDAYIALVTANAAVARSYICYFGDIYLSAAELLPSFDVVSLFHLCEFFSPGTASPEYGGLDDRGLLDLLTAKTRPGGHILFYKGSLGFERAKPIVADWVRAGAAEAAGEFKTLEIYRKR